MDVDLLNKALALCSEIEERQAQLKDILKSLVERGSAPVDKLELTGQDLKGQSEQPESSIQEVPAENQRQEPSPAPESLPAPELINEPVSLPTPEPETLPAPEPLTVPQPLGGDLRKAFTINDRFRFRRELFEGDDRAMMEVITRLSEAQTFADAQAYLDTLAWDKDNEAVGEFKEIVSTFFNGYRI